jgi:hypothetical protein
MNQYVGLDVSLEETKIHVLDETGASGAVSVRAIPTQAANVRRSSTAQHISLRQFPSQP